MYTRSYSIQNIKEVKEVPVKEESELKLPEGYSGTVMLREQEEQGEKVTDKEAETEEQSPPRPNKQRRFNFSREPKMCDFSSKENEKSASQKETRTESEQFCKENSPFEKINVPCEGHIARKPKIKKSDLDRLLIGALILLLINERADDVLTLILGYILM